MPVFHARLIDPQFCFSINLFTVHKSLANYVVDMKCVGQLHYIIKYFWKIIEILQGRLALLPNIFKCLNACFEYDYRFNGLWNNSIQPPNKTWNIRKYFISYFISSWIKYKFQNNFISVWHMWPCKARWYSYF